MVTRIFHRSRLAVLNAIHAVIRRILNLGFGLNGRIITEGLMISLTQKMKFLGNLTCE
jgi:hypothetical protein